MYRFAKSDPENIDPDEVAGFRKLAQGYLALAEKQIETMLKDKRLKEVV